MLAFKARNPTIRPFPVFNPVEDANNLRKAMKGLGTDEDAIIEIICKRSNTQRQIIRQQYEVEFKRNLMEDITSETSGNFRVVILSLLCPFIDYYCLALKDYLTRKSEEAFTELLCALSMEEIRLISQYYQCIHQTSLSKEIEESFTDSFLIFAIAIISDDRDEGNATDPEAAQKEVQNLLAIIEAKAAAEDFLFTKILCKLNPNQRKLVFDEYETQAGHSFEEGIKKLFSGGFRDALLAMYECTFSTDKFFANRLKLSMKGLGTNDEQLMRIIISRAEADLGNIKEVFLKENGEALEYWVAGDTSGDYKKTMLALL